MIHFITPLYRYNNIKIVYSTIKHQIHDFKWHLIEGDNRVGEDSLDFLKNDERVLFYKIKTNFIYGHEQRNYFITDIKGNNDDWCYFLDDDNIVTKDLVDVSTEEENKKYDVVLFSQKQGLTEKQRLYGEEGHMKLGYCDIGSFIIKYSTIKKTLMYYVDQRNADGHYAEQIMRLPELKIIYKPDKFVRYNSLSLEIL
jgi:hypothetical protein